MRFIVFFAILACAAASSYNLYFNEQFETYKLRFNRNYKSSVDESYRKKIFLDNKIDIANHNQKYYKGESSYLLGINEFTDMLSSELTSRNGFRMNMAKKTNSTTTFMKLDSDIKLPSTMDWREKGAVTEIKNQGQCGSCWAFSSTGSLEGQHFRKTGKLVSLSEQDLVDCCASCLGCNGGLMDYAFTCIQQAGGIDTESSYPYSATDGTCAFLQGKIGADDTGFADIPANDEQALFEAVATVGPIAVAMDANHDDFMSYTDGIYDNPTCSTTELDHGVLVVGYGTTNDGRDYWIMKNSWGTSWGQAGYFWLPRGRNACGIATMASYPLV